MPSVTPSSAKLHKLLKRYWGYDDFRPMQEDIIQSVLHGHDTVALLPTGGGKSLCYQLPAVAVEGTCLVVSPLIALMKDQVERLQKCGIKAACLTSGMTVTEQAVVLNNCLYGKLKLLYVSPERLKNKTFLGHLRQMQISLIAVDEAHCISQWGHDFRPTYLDIVLIRKYHKAPVLALTATATASVMTEIEQRLDMHDPVCFRASFARPNLHYFVVKESNKEVRLLRLLARVEGSAIVYVRNRGKCRQIASMLNANGISATFYHAGLTSRERDRQQEAWMKGTARVVVATNAFGMGVDKADVRCVVHFEPPECIESYYQEAGRAGRDGMSAYAVTLYDEHDITRMQRQLDDAFPSLDQIRNVYDAVCNFYGIPLGSGIDCSYDLDIEAISRAYAFNPTTLYAALRFLEQQGVVSLPVGIRKVSTFYITCSKETLYRFVVSHQRFETMVQGLLRTYGGLFTSFVSISERELSRRLALPESDVVDMLKHLDAMKMAIYIPASKKPQISFNGFRVESGTLTSGIGYYSQLKENAVKRFTAMVHYLTTCDQCRSQQLLDYFDETGEPCGVCDYCIRDMPTTTVSETDVRNTIVQLLHAQPYSPDRLMQSLLAVLPSLDSRYASRILRQMIDERLVSMNADMQLFA